MKDYKHITKGYSDWQDIKNTYIGIFNGIVGSLALWGFIILAYLVFPGSFS